MKYPDVKLGEFEHAALIGSILGDTHIGIDSKGIEARLNFAHCKEQEEYFNNKFDLRCSIHSQRAVYIWKQSVAKFNQLVEPYILPSMQYKLLRS